MRAGVQAVAAAAGMAWCSWASAQGTFTFSGTDDGLSFEFQIVRPGGPTSSTSVGDALIGSAFDAYDGMGLVRVNGIGVGASVFSRFEQTLTSTTAAVVRRISDTIEAEVEWHFITDRAVARQLVTIRNRGRTLEFVGLQIETNTGADLSQQTVATSSNDLVVDTSDVWAVVDDASTSSGDPATSYSVSGSGVAGPVGVPSTFAAPAGEVEVGYISPVFPGETQRYLYFYEIKETAIEATVGAQSFEFLDRVVDAGLLGGLEGYEVAQLVNYNPIPGFWASPAGGSFGDTSNWTAGVVPVGGDVVIETEFPVAVTVPSSFAASLLRLTLASDVGRTSLRMGEDAVVSVFEPCVIGASGELRTGRGVFSAVGGVSNSGVILVDEIGGSITGDVVNSGVVRFDPPAVGDASLAVFGSMTNEPGAELLMTGNAEAEFSAGYLNGGNTDIAFADARLTAEVTNDLGGLVSISGASDVAIVGDVVNEGQIVHTPDSSLSILGSLAGNGVDGPGGGAAGTVFIRDGVEAGGVGTGRAGFGGDLALGVNAVTTLQIGGTTPGLEHDQVAVGGVLGAAGTLALELVPGFTPLPGDAYRVLEFSAVAGGFTSVMLDAGLQGANADVSTLLVDGTVRIPGGCNAADLAEPFGQLTFGDVSAFLGAFSTQDPSADLAAPFGQFTFGDVSAFLAAFSSGCP
jgi:hypothetical protein